MKYFCRRIDGRLCFYRCLSVNIGENLPCDPLPEGLSLVLSINLSIDISHILTRLLPPPQMWDRGAHTRIGDNPPKTIESTAIYTAGSKTLSCFMFSVIRRVDIKVWTFMGLILYELKLKDQ